MRGWTPQAARHVAATRRRRAEQRPWAIFWLMLTVAACALVLAIDRWPPGW